MATVRSREDSITAHFRSSRDTLARAAGDRGLLEAMIRATDAMAAALRGGNKILIAGNGGSAADAQHIAGEFLSRLNFDRNPLPAIALTTDSSVLTAIGNDYGFEQVFERQVRWLGRKGDVFIGISTSGKSPNVLAALEAARDIGVVTVGFTVASADQAIATFTRDSDTTEVSGHTWVSVFASSMAAGDTKLSLSDPNGGEVDRLPIHVHDVKKIEVNDRANQFKDALTIMTGEAASGSPVRRAVTVTVFPATIADSRIVGNVTIARGGPSCTWRPALARPLTTPSPSNGPMPPASPRIPQPTTTRRRCPGRTSGARDCSAPTRCPAPPSGPCLR